MHLFSFCRLPRPVPHIEEAVSAKITTAFYLWHWKGNVIIVIKFSSLAALEVVKMTNISVSVNGNPYGWKDHFEIETGLPIKVYFSYQMQMFLKVISNMCLCKTQTKTECYPTLIEIKSITSGCENQHGGKSELNQRFCLWQTHLCFLISIFHEE